MKPRKPPLLLLMGIAALFLAYKYVELRYDNRHYEELDGYAKAFALKQTGANDQDELRLWFLEPMEGGITSHVFTENGAYECEGKAASGSCKKSKIGLSKTVLESKLLLLGKLKRKSASCDNVADGWGITVDGVLDGERFAFQAWNPDGCDNPNAKSLIEILESIGNQKS